MKGKNKIQFFFSFILKQHKYFFKYYYIFIIIIFCYQLSGGKSSSSMFTYDNKLTANVACSSKYRNSASNDKIKKPINTADDLQKINNMENKLFKLDNNVVETMPLDLRLDNELVNDKILPMSIESSSVIIKDKNKVTLKLF